MQPDRDREPKQEEREPKHEDREPKHEGTDRSSRTMFLVMFALIIGLIAAFLLLRPTPS